jgi:hypothetical protein
VVELSQYQDRLHQFVERISYFFVCVSWGRVRQSPLGTSATVWPIVPAPDDR